MSPQHTNRACSVKFQTISLSEYNFLISLRQADVLQKKKTIGKTTRHFEGKSLDRQSWIVHHNVQARHGRHTPEKNNTSEVLKRIINHGFLYVHLDTNDSVICLTQTLN